MSSLVRWEGKEKKTLKEVIICEKEEDMRTKEEEIAGFACRSKGGNSTCVYEIVVAIYFLCDHLFSFHIGRLHFHPANGKKERIMYARPLPGLLVRVVCRCR